MAVLDLTRGQSLSFTAHGLAEYIASTPVAQRRTLLDYLFPDDAKPKVIQTQPARTLAQSFLISGCDPTVLHDALNKARNVPVGETAHARARRQSVLAAIESLPRIAAKYGLEGLERPRFSMPIAGLLVKASVDLIATESRHAKKIALILNTSQSIASRESSLKHYAKVQCEVALRAAAMKGAKIDQAWYVDICTGELIKKQATPIARNWREIEIMCDKIAIEMKELLRRRARQSSISEL